MSKLIVVNDVVADPSAPRIIRTPGVGGYLSRFIAGHLNLPAGSTVSSWNSVSGTAPSALTTTGSTVTVVVENGITHLNTPGGTGGRLLGPHLSQRPQTLVAVVRSTVAASTVVSVSGQSATHNADGTWQGVGGASAFTGAYVNNGWTFIIISQAADNSYMLRADYTESPTVAGVTPPTSFGGIYFGPGTAGQTADVREIIHYPTQLSLTDRNAVHAYMKTRYPELV
jgi:hypothetical protein